MLIFYSQNLSKAVFTTSWVLLILKYGWRFLRVMSEILLRKDKSSCVSETAQIDPFTKSSLNDRNLRND